MGANFMVSANIAAKLVFLYPTPPSPNIHPPHSLYITDRHIMYMIKWEQWFLSCVFFPLEDFRVWTLLWRLSNRWQVYLTWFLMETVVSQKAALPDNWGCWNQHSGPMKSFENLIVYCPVAVFCSDRGSWHRLLLLVWLVKVKCRRPVCFSAHAVWTYEP